MKTLLTQTVVSLASARLLLAHAVTFALLHGTFICYGQETIKIYHGEGGTSSIVAAASGQKILDGTRHTVVVAEGQDVTIELLNPNPVLYNYNFEKTDLKIDDEPLPDITLLVKVLSNVLGLQVPKSTANGGAVPAGSELATLEARITNLRAVMLAIDSFINNSDGAETIGQALGHSRNAGFRRAIAQIRAKYFAERLSTYEQSLLSQLQKVVVAKEFPDLDGDGNMDQIFEEAFRAYISNFGSAIKEIEKNFVNNDVKTLLKFSFRASKNESIKFSVGAKTGGSLRDIGEILVIQIRPYRNALLEVIPFYSMLYSAGKINYSISDGKITETSTTDFTFRPGAALLLNVYRFGKFREFSLGPGLGFSIRKDTDFLENFSISALLSYREIVRVGLGWGQQQYPVSLKSGVSVGGVLPNNVNGINDVIEYKGRPAFMIHFSILGLKIPGQ